MSHIIIVRMYQLMQFFNLKLSYMRYQVILFSTCSYGTPRFCAFLDWNWDLEVTAHLYRLNHFCNLNLTCLRYQISYVMCQLMSNMSHLFVLPKSACLFFYNLFLVYLLVFFVTAWQESENLKCRICPLSEEEDKSNVKDGRS